MKWQTSEGMRDYLAATDLCDSDSQAIKNEAEALTEKAESPREAAERIFYFVRDEILFGLDRRDVKASQTLQKRFGFCVTKTNVHVALLRAAGVPARYHQAIVDKESLRGFVPTFAYGFAPERIWYHPWCECHLSDRWISCDTLFDKGLYEGALAKGIISREQIPKVDWDGENDLNIAKFWILEDVGISSCLDDVFRKAQSELPPRPIANTLRFFCNRYINKLRQVE